MGSPPAKVRDLLETKGRTVITVGPKESIIAAIQKLVENNIGALPVCDARNTLLGIVSERDLLTECSQLRWAINRTRVEETMTTDIAVGTLDDDLDYVTDIVTLKGIRHLPILDGPRLAGIVTMRDVVEARPSESRSQVRFMSDYISGWSRPD